jgi:leader peptidase (prepilin peptidase) / N-methyltransferase
LSVPIVAVSRDPHRAWLLAALGWAAFVLAVAVVAPVSLVPVAVVWAIPTAGAAAIDATTGRLPDIIVITGAAAVLATAALVDRSIMALVGAALLAGPMLVVHLARPDGMGFGDVKFGLLLGAGLGAVALPLVVVAYLAASALHAASCVVLRSRHRLLPFGPALAVASAVTMSLGLWRLP